jgi:polysaccharide export outer membrane protein
LSVFLWQQAAVAQPVANPQSEARPAVAADYRINPGDELQIHVWGEERLQGPVRVLPDGTIAFPLVGTLVAQGQRPQELQAAISNGLRGQYRGDVPQVTVSVVSPSGLQFSILGRVRSPGTFTPGRYVNILEALSLAGGPNEFANLDNVLIIRKVGDQLRTFRVSISALFKGGSDANRAVRNVTRLETGDTIIVP